MALLAPNVGEALLLKYFLNNTAPTNVKYHLYSNNHTPAAADTISSYTESTMPGYSAQAVTGAGWSTSGGNPTTATASQLTFTFTGSGSLYGYYVTDNANTQVLWAELFAGGPLSYGTSGGQLLLTPTIGLT